MGRGEVFPRETVFLRNNEVEVYRGSDCDFKGVKVGLALTLVLGRQQKERGKSTWFVLATT